MCQVFIQNRAEYEAIEVFYRGGGCGTHQSYKISVSLKTEIAYPSTDDIPWFME